LPNKNRGNCIVDATLQKLRTYDRRGETKYVILIGACGYGKTLMLQHLFPIRTKSGEPICFGYAYTVDPQSLTEQPELKAIFIELCKAAQLDEMFAKVRKYYENIVRKQRENEYN